VASIVFLVDDDASFLRAVARLLRAQGYVVQTCGSAQELLGRLSAETTGCVVTDLQMPGLSGLDLQQTLARASNPLPVVFLTGQGDIPATVRAMRLGAEDFLTKRAPKEKLFEAVDRALERDASERAQRDRLRSLRERLAALSGREMEVLEQVVRGRLNKQIAADLDINERTVKLHRTNITRRLGVRSVAELTRMVEQAGLFKSAGDR
jgi:FixJ family two-component response regulator